VWFGFWGGALMPGFSDYESLQEFKDRLNCLTEKLKNTSRAQVKQEKSG